MLPASAVTLDDDSIVVATSSTGQWPVWTSGAPGGLVDKRGPVRYSPGERGEV
jgi:hypothetical protein